MEWFMFYAFLSLALFSGDDARASRYPRQEVLVEARELAGHLHDSAIVDVRSRQDYLAGHIPTAIWVDESAWSKAFAANQAPEVWSSRLGGLGLDPARSVVVYDGGVTPAAGRIWWILRYLGYGQVRLLNGGLRAWKSAGGPLEREEHARSEQAHAKTTPSLTPQNRRLATKDQILDALPARQLQILDARSAGEHCGLTRTARRNGAIPGSIHLEWSEVVDRKTQRLKSPEELRKLFQDKGIDLEKPVVTHCQSGGRSSVLAFALELMGASDVRNYYRSWAEWGNAEDTPVEKPKP
jgi:thiosulfate/3-mercaptopyruvate sulfurtransferase